MKIRHIYEIGSVLMVVVLIVSCGIIHPSPVYRCNVNHAIDAVDTSNPSIEDIPVLIQQMIRPDCTHHGMEIQDNAYSALKLICLQEGGVEGIIQVLEDDDEELRENAATVIGALIRQNYIQYDQEPLLVPSLLEALADESDPVILNTCSTLGDIVRIERIQAGDGEVSSENPSGLPAGILDEILPVLIVLLDHENPDIRVSASNTLNYMGSDADDSIPILTQMLEDDDFLVRVAAAVALTRIDPDRLEVIPVLIDGVENGDESFAPRYRPFTGWDNPSSVAGTSALSLGLMGPTAINAIPSLIRLLKSEHTDVQIAAAEAIAAIDPHGEQSVPILIELLDHENPDVRGIAATTLGLIGPPAHDALAVLKEMLEDPVEPVREVRGEIRAAIEKIESEE